MGFEYLNGKNWKDISRDERRFCADLVFQLQLNRTQRAFVEWVIKKNELKINDFNDFEIDFEVCFYRDLIFNYEFYNKVNLEGKKKIKGLLKRTFDICIFLPNDIIIIEAKAAQGMTSAQMIEFKYDKLTIKACISNLGFSDKKIHVIGLVSSEYSTNTIKKLNKDYKYFDGIVSWQDIENEKLLKYKQPDKLRSVYSETNQRKKFSKKEHKLISKLSDLTKEMENERDNLASKNS